MGDLSPRLSRSEFACKCGCGFHTADIKNVEMLEDIADHFQTIHQGLRCYIVINSGCRCHTYNEVVQERTFSKRGNIYVKNSSKSRHMLGDAVDFNLVIETFRAKFKVDPNEVYQYLDAKFPRSNGIGKYVTFTHFDQGPHRRW